MALDLTFTCFVDNFFGLKTESLLIHIASYLQIIKIYQTVVSLIKWITVDFNAYKIFQSKILIW